MKNILITLMLLNLFSCGPDLAEYEAIKRKEADSIATSEYYKLDKKNSDVEFEIVVFEGCEYLKNENGNSIHKGNCTNH